MNHSSSIRKCSLCQTNASDHNIDRWFVKYSTTIGYYRIRWCVFIWSRQRNSCASKKHEQNQLCESWDVFSNRTLTLHSRTSSIFSLSRSCFSYLLSIRFLIRKRRCRFYNINLDHLSNNLSNESRYPYSGYMDCNWCTLSIGNLSGLCSYDCLAITNHQDLHWISGKWTNSSFLCSNLFLQTIFKFFAYLFNIIATVFFIVMAGVSLWWLIFFKVNLFYRWLIWLFRLE